MTKEDMRRCVDLMDKKSKLEDILLFSRENWTSAMEEEWKEINKKIDEEIAQARAAEHAIKDDAERGTRRRGGR